MGSCHPCRKSPSLGPFYGSIVSDLGLRCNFECDTKCSVPTVMTSGTGKSSLSRTQPFCNYVHVVLGQAVHQDFNIVYELNCSRLRPFVVTDSGMD